jgi:hypothetical protein
VLLNIEAWKNYWLFFHMEERKRGSNLKQLGTLFYLFYIFRVFKVVDIVDVVVKLLMRIGVGVG